MPSLERCLVVRVSFLRGFTEMYKVEHRENSILIYVSILQ